MLKKVVFGKKKLPHNSNQESEVSTEAEYYTFTLWRILTAVPNGYSVEIMKEPDVYNQKAKFSDRAC